LSWGLASFVRYQQRPAGRDLASFSVLMLLASASHFGGFLVVFVCGVHAGARLAISRRWRALTVFASALVPFLLLGGVFAIHSLAPGAAGPTWHRAMWFAGLIAPASPGARLAAG